MVNTEQKSMKGLGSDGKAAAVGILDSHAVEIDLPERNKDARPSIIQHLSTPAYQSPLRHHQRQHSTQHVPVKETLDARSEYTNSQDDGTAQHSINQYIIKEEIGRGSFGAVHLACDQYGKEYAIKEFSKSRLRKRAQSHILRKPQDRRKPGHLAAGGVNSPLHKRTAGTFDEEEQKKGPLYLIKEEIAIMKKLDHPNLVSLIEVLDDPDEDSLYMVLEMCKKGVIMNVGLGETAEPYSAEQCRLWFRDLILGIEYLHAQGIVHRDIKPDNLLLTEDDVLKIVDFGVSEMFEKESDMMTAKSAGSPAFLPPELCIAKHGDISGKAADIWSMGVCLYCMRFGKIPFERSGVLDLYEAIRKDDVDFSSEEEPTFRDLMKRILEKDPKKRIVMDDLRVHSWVTKNGEDPLLPKDDNINELLEPPTEAEKNHAITGNFKNLLVVMRAVHKFKSLTWNKRPSLLSKLLGTESRIVHPPGQLHESVPSKKSGAGHRFHLAHRSQSSDLDNRVAIERSLITEGVSRVIDPNNMNIFRYDKAESSTMSGFSKTTNKKEDSAHARSQTVAPDGASHTPHEEKHFYLGVGAGLSRSKHDIGQATIDEVDLPFQEELSESPLAADFDIYSTAYADEVAKIHKNQGRDTKLYLTRRVDRDNIEGGVADSTEVAANKTRGGLLGAVDAMKSQAKTDNDERSESISDSNISKTKEYEEYKDTPAVDTVEGKDRSMIGVISDAKDEALLRFENVGLKLKARGEEMMNTMDEKGLNKEGVEEMASKIMNRKES